MSELEMKILREISGVAVRDSNEINAVGEAL